jgi:uncharacterized membrane protein
MALAFVALFGAGLLAGEEFVVRYGVRGPLARLADEPHLRLRQALVRTLRILVPAIYLPTLVLAAVATALHPHPAGVAAVAALVAWIVVTLAGTVPINAAVLEWDPVAPPPDWRSTVDRWERLNTVRAWLAVAAFALLLIATAIDLGT